MFWYTIRLFLLLWRYSSKPTIKPTDTVSQRMRAWPWLCDYNLHINNAHYLSLMEKGRMEWLTRTRFLRGMFKKKINMVMAGLTVTYRREIRLNATFTQETTLVGWDERWIYYEQTLFLPSSEGRKVAMRALLRCQFLKGRDLLEPEEAFARLGWTPDSPIELTTDLREWLQAADSGMDVIRELDRNN